MQEKKERKLEVWKKSVFKIHGGKIMLLVESAEKIANGWKFKALSPVWMSNVHFHGVCDLNLDIE